MRLFMGTVKKVGDAQEIEFTIPEFAEDPTLYATPMMRNTRFPQPKDEVIIFQPDARFEIFLYMLTPEFTLSSDEEEFDKISLQLNNPEMDEDGEAKENKHGLIELSKDSDSKYKATIQISDDIYMVFDEKDNYVEIKLDDETYVKIKKGDFIEAKIGTGTLKMTSTETVINSHFKVTV